VYSPIKIIAPDIKNKIVMILDTASSGVVAFNALCALKIIKAPSASRNKRGAKKL
jgi:hypothetical protein